MLTAFLLLCVPVFQMNTDTQGALQKTPTLFPYPTGHFLPKLGIIGIYVNF